MYNLRCINFEAMEEKSKYKVIIVDDDDFLVDMYSVKFNHIGVETEVCKSGQVLLDKLRASYKADLLLLDIVMPGMDGIEILRTMRKEKLGEDILVVILTNQNDEKNINEAKILGVSGYVVKSSATPSELVAEVIRIIKSPTKI